MSIESARKFIEQLKTDQSLYHRVAACDSNAARLSLILSEGFDCTEDEIESAAKELSDAEVEMMPNGGVAGDATLIEYRHGDAPLFSTITMPGIWRRPTD